MQPSALFGLKAVLKLLELGVNLKQISRKNPDFGGVFFKKWIGQHEAPRTKTGQS